LANTLHESFCILQQIEQRTLPIETIHQKLNDIGKTLKKMINHREKYLKEENLSVINLSTVVHLKTLTDNQKVLIKVSNISVEINIADGVDIQDNFNKYNYSINKVNNKQEIYYAHEDDAQLHYLVYKYKSVKGNYTYRVGNRITLKPYGGTYKIVEINPDYAIITCKKWFNEKKPNRKVKISDIKGLASNEFNSISSW